MSQGAIINARTVLGGRFNLVDVWSGMARGVGPTTAHFMLLRLSVGGYGGGSPYAHLY